MYNPFVPFDLQLLLALRASGQQYLVRENFPRGAPLLPQGFKASVLLTDYQHFEDAQRHLKSILFDRRAFLYNLNDPKHYERLEIAATGLSGYLIFASRIPTPWTPTPEINTLIRQYIARHHPHWHVPPDHDIPAQLSADRGQLILSLHHLTHHTSIPFASIEPNLDPR